MPAPRSSCGSAAVNPKQSGIQQTVWYAPKRRRNQRCPYSSWRTSDSPAGMLQSGSTHIPPIGSSRRVAASAPSRSSSSGSSSSRQAYTCAVDWLKCSSG